VPADFLETHQIDPGSRQLFHEQPCSTGLP